MHLAPLAVAASLVAQLDSAAIEIELGDGEASVVASYAVTPHRESITFRAIRLFGQRLLLETTSPAGQLEERDGLYEWSTSLPGAGSRVISLHYVVRGAVERVPLFVPDTPTVSGEPVVGIRVTGSEGRDPQDGFPRMRPTGGGAIVATPANVPSFVSLPVHGTALSVNRLADRLVLSLLVTATGFWLVRARREIRRRRWTPRSGAS